MKGEKALPSVEDWVRMMAAYMGLIVIFGVAGWYWMVAALSVAVCITGIGLAQAIMRRADNDQP